jgi:hypothetical protein
MTSRTQGRGASRCGLIVTACMLSGAPAFAQETVQISVPGIVSFAVPSVSQGAVGSPDPTHISFSNAVLNPGNTLRISVRADGDLMGANGPSIPASNVSWTASNVSNGVAVNGTLSTGAYTQVFQSNVGATSGGFDAVWTLAAPGPSVNAGTHQAMLRWKLESVP